MFTYNIFIYTDTHIYIIYIINIYIYIINLSKTTHHGTGVKWSIKGGGWFRELIYPYVILLANIWDPTKVIDIAESSICGGGRLERVYCISIFAVYIYIYIYVCVYIQ